MTRFVWPVSRNGLIQDHLFPDVIDALRPGLDRAAALDGEIVCFDEGGHTSFQALQQRFHLTTRRRSAAGSRRIPASFYVFDILYLDVTT